jgi:hypothetical protein
MQYFFPERRLSKLLSGKNKKNQDGSKQLKLFFEVDHLKQKKRWRKFNFQKKISYIDDGVQKPDNLQFF